MLAVTNIPQFLRRQVGDFFIEGCLLIVRLFVWPGEMSGHSHLSLRTNEDVLRTHVSNFGVGGVEGLSSTDDGVDQVPKLRLLKELALHVAAIDDLVAQQVWIVLVGNLHGKIHTVAIPPLPQNSVFSKRLCRGKNRFYD